ncbi:MAG: hypothetical protein CEN89_206 [Candidatus Berkelbacteria bacterium Licking1014_7]|uniref:DUF6922 domain-containing protein n=1 Tax=Candidatus Berkelbacteria bacterium Licking1014_7 TaxID=2017147 RepID=A0A554LJY8_9BACT|nr:MAG: hypothetical protein CEN89_206 [Candidatus Berkelbacteria bacterium Licking1014_7]
MQKEKNKFPKFLKRYFWDTDFSLLDRQKNQKYIIERILDWGDEQGIEWLFQTYSSQEIKAVVLTSRELFKKSINFWGIILELGEKWRKEALAKRQNKIWNY